MNTNQTIRDNTIEEDNNSIITNNYLERRHLPILILSLHQYRKSNDRNIEIENVVDEIINQIRVKGKVTDRDVQNILIDNDLTSYNVHILCKIKGDAWGWIFIFPFALIMLLSVFLNEFMLVGPIFYIGGLLYWYGGPETYDYPAPDITVGSKKYTTSHDGKAFGFFGRVYVSFVWSRFYFVVDGRALIAFVK